MQFHNCLVVSFLLVLVIAVGVAQKQEDADKEVFVATKEWQIVKKGQKIPKGLHVRINLEAGLTEAKLLEEEQNQEGQALSFNPNDNEPIIDESLLFSKDLEAALKNIKGDDPKPLQSGKDKFRSYEDLKQEMADINLSPKTDAEILKELINQYQHIASSTNYQEQELLNILEDVEYLVHQYDNAKEFTDHDGFRKIIYKNLNSTSIALKLVSLKLLGSSMQNNPKIQIHAIETGAIDILLRMLSLESDIAVKNSVMYAIGALLRRFPLAQTKFLENAGLSVFSKLFDSKDIKIQVKLVTLLNDLLFEHDNAVNDTNALKVNQYKRVNLKARLLDGNFCSHVNNLLVNIVTVDSNDYDSIEKTLQFMYTLLGNCKSTHTDTVVKAVALVIDHLSKLTSADEDENYFADLQALAVKLIKHMKNNLKQEL